MKREILFFLLLVIPLTLPAQTDSAASVDDIEIGIVEKLDQYIPLDVSLFDENGDTVLLSSLFDKPTLISFVYFRCPGICSPLMDGIADVIDKSDLVIGKDYQVLTISFDPREDQFLAAKKKNNYLNLMEKKDLAKEGWHFFTGDSASIKRLTDATGFRYKPAGNDFVHAATLIFTDPHGKITRYMNGTYFLPFEVKMSVIDAGKGISGPTINKVLQYCYSYDPEGQSYVLNITKVAGTMILFIALILFLVLILVRKKNKN